MTMKSSSLITPNEKSFSKTLKQPEVHSVNIKELSQKASVLKESFLSAQPFPHIVLDNFLDLNLIQDVIKEFPMPEEKYQHGSDKKVVNGFQTSPLEVRNRPAMKAMFDLIESEQVRNALAKICNSETEILCDPEYMGSGLLIAKDGGIHKVHRDRNRHPKTNLYPRLVLLIYFNEEWCPEYGGSFQLWDRKISESVSIEPLFNRCIIFENTKYAYHGISDVHLPPGMTRKALNFYYYTAEIPKTEREMYVHDTDFFPRPEERRQYWLEASNFWFNVVKSVKNKYQPLTKACQELKYQLSGKSEALKAPDEEVLKPWQVYNSKTHIKNQGNHSE
jgi:Rps23 Pro-64 3,4-dihydroxylase Tpa1-like proline 4-hydroxylase